MSTPTHISEVLKNPPGFEKCSDCLIRLDKCAENIIGFDAVKSWSGYLLPSKQMNIASDILKEICIQQNKRNVWEYLQWLCKMLKILNLFQSQWNITNQKGS